MNLIFFEGTIMMELNLQRHLIDVGRVFMKYSSAEE